MDEPTASLDFGNQVRVLGPDRARSRAAASPSCCRRTIPTTRSSAPHRVALLHRGRLARLGPPNDVITRDSLREVYGVEVMVTEVARPDGRVAHVCVPALGPDGV